MKEHTSRFLKIIANLYLAFPITYLAYAMVLFNISSTNGLKIFFSFGYWMLAFTGIVVGYGFREMTRWSWSIFLFNSLFVAYANARLIFLYSESAHSFIAFIVSVALLICLIFRLGREIRVPYFLPRIRWWEMNPRYKLVVPVKVEQRGTGFEGEILDISLGGCFIKTRVDLTQNERILCRFSIFGESLEITGTVVWRSQSSVTHPKGVGVKFDPLEKLQKRIMKAATRHLKKISAVQRGRNRLSVGEFNQKMAKLKSHQLGVTGITSGSKSDESLNE